MMHPVDMLKIKAENLCTVHNILVDKKCQDGLSDAEWLRLDAAINDNWSRYAIAKNTWQFCYSADWDLDISDLVEA